MQGDLLPKPAPQGIVGAARYLPSGHAGQVGGDWYDLFALPDGALGVAVGDVMGHDVADAAAAGVLRGVLRSYAYAASSPSTVLDQLNQLDRLVQGLDLTPLATAFYAGSLPTSTGLCCGTATRGTSRRC